jgi:hypothetical protein
MVKESLPLKMVLNMKELLLITKKKAKVFLQ